MRLQKFMAKCGVASRRASENLIIEGRVKVNNKIVTELGTKINPYKDTVKVNNNIIKLETKKIYIILNKPRGYITTLNDESNRKIVTDLIKGVEERIYPVGRLDKETTGLLLLTNDGDVTYKLTHPSNEVIKRYIAKVEGIPNKKELDKFRNGLVIDGVITSPAKIKISQKYDNQSILDISIHEGRNRQVRKMCDAINHPVKELKRISIGNLSLNNLQLGHWRYLNSDEIKYLKKL